MSQRWKVVIAFVGVFVSGMVAGGPLLGRWQAYRYDRRPPFMERTMVRYERELGITDAQKEKIRPILLRVQTEWRALRQEHVRELTDVIDRMHREVAAELTPEQRVKLQTMHEELKIRVEQLRGRSHEREERQRQRSRS